MSQRKKNLYEGAGFWFMILMCAAEEGDFEAAREATVQLRKMGWNVSHVRTPDNPIIIIA